MTHPIQGEGGPQTQKLRSRMNNEMLDWQASFEPSIRMIHLTTVLRYVLGDLFAEAQGSFERIGGRMFGTWRRCPDAEPLVLPRSWFVSVRDSGWHHHRFSVSWDGLDLGMHEYPLE